ncbi:MAG TPA: hypothetical protein VF475_09070 [Sphingobium sp.]
MTAIHIGRAAVIRGKVDVSPWLEASIAKYEWIWIGLTFGFAAKYALLIKKGIKVRVSLVLADILLLPMVALIAYTLVTQAGVTGEAAALLTAICTVLADRIIKLYTERFMQKVQAITLQDVTQEMIASRGDLRNTVQTVRSAHDIVDRSAASAD